MPAHRPPRPTHLPACLGLVFATALAACGGGGDGGAAQPAPPTTLSISASALALAASGNARALTVTNTGSQPAQAVQVGSGAALPAGTVLASTCGTLAAGASCTVTITPGATPSAAPGDTSPVAVDLTVSGSNTNTVTAQIQVLAHGSVYQSGYVFSIDDSTPVSGSIGGKVAGLADVSASINWSVSGGVASDINVPGASSLTDGTANTTSIVAALAGESPSAYAAGLCQASNSGGYSDWYLPAVCETGYDANGAATGCGTQASPLTDNWQSSLVNNSIGNLSPGQFWTSTQFSGFPAQAWTALLGGGPSALSVFKSTSQAVRCVRALTL